MDKQDFSIEIEAKVRKGGIMTHALTSLPRQVKIFHVGGANEATQLLCSIGHFLDIRGQMVHSVYAHSRQAHI